MTGNRNPRESARRHGYRLAVVSMSLALVLAAAVGPAVTASKPGTPGSATDRDGSPVDERGEAGPVDRTASATNSSNLSEIRRAAESYVTDDNLSATYRSFRKRGLNDSFWDALADEAIEAAEGGVPTVDGLLVDSTDEFFGLMGAVLTELASEFTRYAGTVAGWAADLVTLLIATTFSKAALDYQAISEQLDGTAGQGSIRSDLRTLEENAENISHAPNRSAKRDLYEKRKRVIERLYRRLPEFVDDVYANIWEDPRYTSNIIPIGGDWKLGTPAYTTIRWNVEALRSALFTDYAVTTTWLANESSNASLVDRTGVSMPTHKLGWSTSTARVFDALESPDDYTVYAITVERPFEGWTLRVRLRGGSRGLDARLTDSAPNVSAPEGARLDPGASIGGVDAGTYYVVVTPGEGTVSENVGDGSLGGLRYNTTSPYALVATLEDRSLLEYNQTAPELTVGRQGIGNPPDAVDREPDPAVFVALSTSEAEPPGDRRVVEPGDRVIVNATVINTGGAARSQRLSVGLPWLDDTSRVSVLNHSFNRSVAYEPARVIGPNTTIKSSYGNANTTVEGVLVRGFATNWTTGERHYVTFAAEVPGDASGTLAVTANVVAKAPSSWGVDPEPRTTSARNVREEFAYTTEFRVNGSGSTGGAGLDEIATSRTGTRLSQSANTGFDPDGVAPPENVYVDWRYSIDSAVRSSPLAAGDTVYVGADDGTVRALNAETGASRWRYRADGAVASGFALANGTLYAGSDDDYVYALDADTGDLEWRYGTGGDVTSTPVVRDGIVYVGSHDGRVHALDAETGVLQWRLSPDSDRGSVLASSPTIVNGTAYATFVTRSAVVGDRNAYVLAFDAATGNASWQRRITRAGSSFGGRIGAPAVVDGAVYAGDPTSSKVVALETSDGSTIWRFGTDAPVDAAPAVVDTTVYAGTRGGTVYMLRGSDGVKLQEFVTNGRIGAQPRVVDGVVHVPSADWHVYGLRSAGLAEEWRIETGGAVTGATAVAGGRVYVGSGDGDVYALASRERPTTRLDHVPETGVAGTPTTFRANGSYDRNGSIASVEWDFDGDGEVEATGMETTHRFNRPGVRPVTLTITDDENATATLTERVFVQDPDAWSDPGFVPEQVGYNPAGTGPATNLTEQWRFRADANVTGSPAAKSGGVFVGSENGTVYRLDATTGAVDWRFEAGGAVVAAPLVRGDTVYAGSTDGKLYALDAATGDLRWRFRTGGAIRSAPTVVDGRVYLGSDGDRLYVLDADGGSKLWAGKVEASRGVVAVSSPAVVDGLVYATFVTRSAVVGDRNAHVAAFGADTGNLKWQRRITRAGSGFEGRVGAPAVAGGRVYAGDPTSSKVVALDAVTGERRWRFSTSGPVDATPAVAGGVVYASSRGNDVYALNASTGSKVQSFETDGAVVASPAVVDGHVYVGSTDGSVYVFERGSLVEAARYDTGEPVAGGTAVANGAVYVGTRNRSVYAIGTAVDVTGNRTIDDPVDPGDTVNVTVRVNARRAADSPAVDEDLPPGFTVASWSAVPDATFRASETQWLWRSVGANDTYVLEYALTVPADADRGSVYRLHGAVSTAVQAPTSVAGDRQVEIALCPGRAVAGDDGRLSLTEIQRAILWWAGERVVPGTDDRTISLTEIQRLINAWATNAAVDCSL